MNCFQQKDNSVIITSATAVQAIIAMSRALIVGLALIPLTLVILAAIPALAFMPFLPDGITRIEAFVGRIATWSVSILINSRNQS